MSTINSDFALFDDIMDDVETNLREEENLFHVSPHGNGVSTEEEEEKNDKEVHKVNEEGKTDDQEEKEDIPAIDLEVAEFDQKEVEDESNHISHSGYGPKEQIKKNVVRFKDSCSKKQEEEEQEEQKGKKENEEKIDSSRNTVYKWNFNSFLEILDNLSNNECSQKTQFDSEIDIVAKENKNETSFETLDEKLNDEKECYCENCPSNIYRKSNFPTVGGHFKENKNEAAKMVCCKKKRKRKAKGEKKKSRAAKENPVFKVKAKLDSNLKDSGNPFLQEWLDNKNKLERAKREEKRMLRKTESEKPSVTNLTEDKKDLILQRWIERKRQEMREKKYKISLSLVADKQKPIRHDFMRRPKTAVPSKPFERKPKIVIKPTTESKDILFPKKHTRPNTSPGKRVIAKEAESFEEFRKTYLNDETTPTGYTSVKLFVKDIVKDAVEELDKQIRIKRARHIRPNTASRTNASIMWRPQVADERVEKKRPKTGVNRHVQFQPEPDKVYTSERGFVKTYDEWLVEKLAEHRKRKDKLSRDTYYSKLEKQIYKEEQERRKMEIQASKKQVNAGGYAPKGANVYAIQQQPSDLRLEPQGSEKNDMKLDEDAFSKL